MKEAAEKGTEYRPKVSFGGKQPSEHATDLGSILTIRQGNRDPLDQILDTNDLVKVDPFNVSRYRGIDQNIRSPQANQTSPLAVIGNY